MMTTAGFVHAVWTMIKTISSAYLMLKYQKIFPGKKGAEKFLPSSDYSGSHTFFKPFRKIQIELWKFSHVFTTLWPSSTPVHSRALSYLLSHTQNLLSSNSRYVG